MSTTSTSFPFHPSIPRAGDPVEDIRPTESYLDRAAEVLADWVLPGVPPEVVAQALAKAGLLAPEPQIIRTREELADLDPDTVLMTTDLFDPLTLVWDWLDGKGNPARGTENGLPAVVIATGDHARAARQALEEA